MFLATLYNPQIADPLAHISGEAYINRIVPILINIGIIVCAIAFIILLIIGGIKYVTSGGDRAKLEGARSAIGNAITGIIILLLLWFILQILNLIFGVNIGGFGPPGIRPTSPPVPTVGVPTPTTSPGDCFCDQGFVTRDDCIPPYYAECVGLWNCHCVLPGVPTPTPGGGVGSPCTIGANCASGLCGQDMDGDTFPGSGSGLCLATGTAMDCNDSNNLVFPGQTAYFETPVGGVGSNYDYDCNGTNDRWPRLNCMSTLVGLATCQLTPFPDNTGRAGWQGSIPGCGQTVAGSSSGPYWNDCWAEPYHCLFQPGWSQYDCNAPHLCMTGNDPSNGDPLDGWVIGAHQIPQFEEYLIEGHSRMPCK